MNGEHRRLNFLLEGITEMAAMVCLPSGDPQRSVEWLDEWACALQFREVTLLLGERIAAVRAALERNDRTGALQACLEEPSLPLLARGLHGVDQTILREWDLHCVRRTLPRVDSSIVLGLIAEALPSSTAWPREAGLAFARLAGWPGLSEALRAGPEELAQCKTDLEAATKKFKLAEGSHAENARLALLQRLRLHETLMLWGEDPQEQSAACQKIRADLLPPVLASQIRLLAAGLPDTVAQIHQILAHSQGLGVGPFAVLPLLPDWAANQVGQSLRELRDADRREAVFQATDAREILAAAEARSGKLRFSDFSGGADALARAMRLDPSAHRASFEEQETRLAFEEWARDFSNLTELGRLEQQGNHWAERLRLEKPRQKKGSELHTLRRELTSHWEEFQKARKQVRGNFVDDTGLCKTELVGKGWREALDRVTGELRRRSRILWTQVGSLFALVVIASGTIYGLGVSHAEADLRASGLRVLMANRAVGPVAEALSASQHSLSCFGTFRWFPVWHEVERETLEWIQKEREVILELDDLVGQLGNWKTEVPESLEIAATWTDPEAPACHWARKFEEAALLEKKSAPDLAAATSARFHALTKEWDSFRVERRSKSISRAEAAVDHFAQILQAGRDRREDPDLKSLLAELEASAIELDLPGVLPLEPLTGACRILEEMRPDAALRQRVSQCREAGAALVAGLNAQLQWEDTLRKAAGQEAYLSLLLRQPVNNVTEPLLPVGMAQQGGKVLQAMPGHSLVDLVFGRELLSTAKTIHHHATPDPSAQPPGGTGLTPAGRKAAEAEVKQAMGRAAVPFPGQLNDREKALLNSLRSDWMIQDIHVYLSSNTGKVLNYSRGLPTSKELPLVAVPEGVPAPPKVTEYAGDLYSPSKSPEALAFMKLASKVSENADGETTVTGDAMPRISVPKLSEESAFAREVLQAQFDLFAERPKLSLLVMADALLSRKGLNPLFKAHIHLWIADFMRQRPESWGAGWTLFEADAERLRQLFVDKSDPPPAGGDWMVPANNEKWAKPLARYYESLAGKSYVAEHLATAAALAKVETDPFPWYGFIDGAGRVVPFPGGPSGKEIWGLHHDVAQDKVVPAVLFRLAADGRYEEVNHPMALTPLYSASESLMALRSEAEDNAPLKVLLGP